MKPKLKIGSRIRVCLETGVLDPVVYTVVGTRKGRPLVADNWGLVAIRSWVRVP